MTNNMANDSVTNDESSQAKKRNLTKNVTMSLRKKDIDDIESIADELGISKASAVRNSIQLTRSLMRKAKNGAKIQLVDEDGHNESIDFIGLN